MVGVSRGPGVYWLNIVGASAVAIFAAMVACLPTAQAQRSENGALQSISAEDLSRLAEFGDPNSLEYSALVTEPVLWSPQRDRIAVVVREGAPDRGTNRTRVLVYNISTLNRPPDVVVDAESRTIFQPLAFVRWLDNGDALIWAGSREDALPQVYRAALEPGGATNQLTHVDGQLLYYDVSRTGDVLLTMTKDPSTSESCFDSPCRVVDDDLWSILTNTPRGSRTLTLHDLARATEQSLPRPEELFSDIRECDALTRASSMLSPGGRYVARVCELRSLPPAWLQYSNGRHAASCTTQCNQVVLIYDRASGTYRRLGDAPFDPFPISAARPIWTSDHTLLLLFAREPLGRTSGEERTLRRQSYAAVEFDLESGRSLRVFRYPADARLVRRAEWREHTSILRLTWSDSHGEMRDAALARAAEGWGTAGESGSAETQSVMAFAVRQSLNERPVLTATDPRTNFEHVVLDPNQWLNARRVARVDVIEWGDSSGARWQGGLYLPADGGDQRRPLVIQTHGFNPNRFSLTGYANNYIAQALASQGVVVLQVNDRFAGNSPDDLPRARRAYEAAIDELASRGLIDPNRVGMVGWSATGTSVGYMLTHSDHGIAAAALTASADFGYLWFTLSGAPRGAEDLHGSPPYGAGIESWLENAPTFNLERVRTPVLITNGVASPPISSWDWFAGLRRLGRPVDMYWTSEGTHDAYRPAQRIANNQLLLDWFRFWLKEEEDPDPAKQEQYRRWREFRRQQQRLLDQPRPPLLDWTAIPRVLQ